MGAIDNYWNFLKVGLLTILIIAVIGGAFTFYKYWNWLKDPDNRGIVTLLVPIIIAVIGAGWFLFMNFPKSAVTESKPAYSGIHIGGDVKAGRDVVIQQIQITPEQYSAFLEKRDKELNSELSTAEAERRDVLLKEQNAIKVKNENLEKALEEQKAKLAEAYKALEEFKKDFTPDQVKQAQKALLHGETVNAEALFQKALDKSTSQAAEAAYQLGVLAEGHIDYLKAKEYYTQAVQLYPSNPRYLNALGNLQQTLGRYKEAQQHLEQALKIREKTLGPNHLDVAQSLNNLATLYLDQGKYPEAEPLFQRSLKIAEQTFGENNRHVATCLQNLAVLHHAQGKYTAAEIIYRRAMEIDGKALGQTTPM